MKLRIATAALLLAASPLRADPRDFGVPEPAGWIGTTSEWIRGAGLVFGLLNLVLLVIVLRMVRRRGVTSASKALLLGTLVVIPVFVVFLSTTHGMQASTKVDACGECHAMDGHVADLRNPKSDSLAAMHYKNRNIQENQCYTCHSDYGMFGTVSAKLTGLGHVYYNVTGNYEKPIKIRHPYPNVRCLTCHAGAQNFLATHEKEQIDSLMAGKDSCLDCHGPAHTPESAGTTAQAAVR